MYYTGVGSRETPLEVMETMCRLAEWFDLCGFTLRSGGADGADTAFESGASGNSHIYLPWPGFNDRLVFRMSRPSLDAFRLAQSVHPNWDRLGSGARSLHARNCHQVLGDNLDAPSAFLVCWTSDGCSSDLNRSRSTGGTGTAIALASRSRVPVFNLQSPTTLSRLNAHVESLLLQAANDPTAAGA